MVAQDMTSFTLKVNGIQGMDGKESGIRALGGDGNDTFRINGFIKDIVLSGESGSDLFVLHENHYLNKLEWPSRHGVESTFTITDFETGESGDVLDINAFLPFITDSAYDGKSIYSVLKTKARW